MFGKLHHNSKKIIQYDLDGNFIKTWDSSVDLSRCIGVSTAGISLAVNKKIKSIKGFILEFKKNYE